MKKEQEEGEKVCMACECPCEIHKEHTHGEKPGKICVGCGHKQEEGKPCENCHKK